MQSITVRLVENSRNGKGNAPEVNGIAWNVRQKVRWAMAEINIEKMAQNVAKKAIQELRDNGVFVGRWISVSDGLPKPYDEEVMVTTRCGEISKATLIYQPYRTDAEEKGLYNWRFRNCDASFDFVTAWMPLPKPYEPQERSNKECSEPKYIVTENQILNTVKYALELNILESKIVDILMHDIEEEIEITLCDDCEEYKGRK